MLFRQIRRPSDSESISSQTSNATSRATTLPDSWSDAASLNQQKINRLNKLHIQPIQDDHVSTPSSNSASVVTVVDRRADAQRGGNNQFNGGNTQNQQQQKWINPYWGPDWKPGAAVTRSGTNKTNSTITNTQISSAPSVKQLIPGSILINDQGEIDDLTWKNDTRSESKMSDNSFNPGGKYVSDDSGGPGGFLAPVHIQRRIVASSPGVAAHPVNNSAFKRSSSSSNASTQSRPEFNRQQTFPQKTDNNIQPWVNPYWSKNSDNTNQNKNFQPTNNSSGTKPPDKPTSSSEPWKNPYWTDQKPQTSTVSEQKSQQWENPYWKDKNQGANGPALNKSLSFEYKDLPVPPFYDRIYPPYTSSMPIINTTDKASKQDVTDDGDLPYTINSQGVVHYRGAPSSANVTNFAQPPPLIISQYPDAPPRTPNTAPHLQPANSAPLGNTTSTSQAPSSFPNNTASSVFINFSDYPSPETVITEAELKSIQDALLLLKTNPNAIPVVVTSNETRPSDVSFNRQQQQQQSSSIPQNVQFSAPPFTFNSNPQQSSSIPQNVQFSVPSYTHNSDSQQTPSLFTSNYPSSLNEILRSLNLQKPIVLI